MTSHPHSSEEPEAVNPMPRFAWVMPVPAYGATPRRQQLRSPRTAI
jgi:hypothetical protein